MEINELKSIFFKELKDTYPQTEIHSFFYELVKKYWGMTRLDLALKPATTVSSLQSGQMEEALARLKKQEPIQYILGETEFYGLPMLVNKHVLIPRPETEELVDWVLKEYQEKPFKYLLDIGTGSGCIPIALAKNCPDLRVSAVDISQEALATARKNAELNQVNVDFKEMDIRDPDYGTFDIPFDVLVSNPPYVRSLEKAQMAPNVLNFEPHLALFVEDKDALLFYRKIIEFAQKTMTKGGRIYFEINEFLEENLKKLLDDFGITDYTFRKDIYEKTRMLRLTLT